jgi:CO dehydrogenase/acetyl-CoA synthase gamma subunit (corrinoid Fe-S protein)
MSQTQEELLMFNESIHLALYPMVSDIRTQLDRMLERVNQMAVSIEELNEDRKKSAEKAEKYESFVQEIARTALNEVPVALFRQHPEYLEICNKYLRSNGMEEMVLPQEEPEYPSIGSSLHEITQEEYDRRKEQDKAEAYRLSKVSFWQYVKNKKNKVKHGEWISIINGVICAKYSSYAFAELRDKDSSDTWYCWKYEGKDTEFSVDE